MYFLISISAVILVGVLMVYLMIMGNHGQQLRAFRFYLSSLLLFLLGESIIRTVAPTHTLYPYALRLFYFPGQIALYLSFFHFTTIYPFERKLPKQLIPVLLITGLLLAFYPFVFAPDLSQLTMGPWGFVQPNQLSQVAYGSSLSFIKDAILLLLLGSGIVFLLLAHTIADNARLKNHINYLLIVTIGPLFLGSATNFIMPYFQVTNAPFPLLSVGAIISAIVFSYAMSQHQILELRLVIKNSFLYSMLTAIISAAYLAVAQISTFMLTFILPKATILVSYLFVMATLLLAAPLRNKIQWFLDSYIFRDKYEYHHVLNETFAILSCMEERNRLLPALLSLIRKHFRARSIMLILPEDIPAVSIHGETGGYSTRTQTPLTLDAKIMEHFTHQLPTPKPLIINPGVSHISAKFQQLLDEVKLVSEISPAAIIPLYTDRVIGIMILDERDNNRLYGDSDLEILATISREMTTTLLRIRNSHSMANRKITGVTTEVASQRLSDLRNSLRVIQRVKEGFDKKTKREFLQEMISEEEKRLESSIRLLEKQRKSSDKSPKK